MRAAGGGWLGAAVCRQKRSTPLAANGYYGRLSTTRRKPWALSIAFGCRGSFCLDPGSISRNGPSSPAISTPRSRSTGAGWQREVGDAPSSLHLIFPEAYLGTDDAPARIGRIHDSDAQVPRRGTAVRARRCRVRRADDRSSCPPWPDARARSRALRFRQQLREPDPSDRRYHDRAPRPAHRGATRRRAGIAAHPGADRRSRLHGDRADRRRTRHARQALRNRPDVRRRAGRRIRRRRRPTPNALPSRCARSRVRRRSRALRRSGRNAGDALRRRRWQSLARHRQGLLGRHQGLGGDGPSCALRAGRSGEHPRPCPRVLADPPRAVRRIRGRSAGTGGGVRPSTVVHRRALRSGDARAGACRVECRPRRGTDRARCTLQRDRDRANRSPPWRSARSRRSSMASSSVVAPPTSTTCTATTRSNASRLSRGNVGIHLAPVGKRDLLRMVVREGPLPRKTFSMGEADEKRFYVEARRIRAPAIAVRTRSAARSPSPG